MSEALIVTIVLYFVGALLVVIIASVNYGIYEHNLLRTIIKAASGVAWPIVLIMAARRWAIGYLKTRFREELAELLPNKQVQSISPPRVTVADLTATESDYRPGQWSN